MRTITTPNTAYQSANGYTAAPSSKWETHTQRQTDTHTDAAAHTAEAAAAAMRRSAAGIQCRVSAERGCSGCQGPGAATHRVWYMLAGGGGTERALEFAGSKDSCHLHGNRVHFAPKGPPASSPPCFWYVALHCWGVFNTWMCVSSACSHCAVCVGGIPSLLALFVAYVPAAASACLRFVPFPTAFCPVPIIHFVCSRTSTHR